MTATTAAPAVVRPDAAPRPLGHAPALLFCASVGVLVCVIGDALSRSTREGSSAVFWTGLLIIVLPLAYRLAGSEATARERLSLVMVLGLALYAVKVARDPFAFTLPDELVHAYNADEILRRRELFGTNPILTVTPRYPGLEGATSALSTMTGLSTFGAGLIVIAAARLVMVVGLFLLFARVSGSARLAGLGVAVYAGTPNFLLFSAQYSYASLALPLLVALLVVVGERDNAPPGRRAAWLVPIVLLMGAVVVTHHLTAYAMVGILAALAVAHALVRRPVAGPNPWPLAVLAAVLVAAWLAEVAHGTGDYLGPVLRRAAEASLRTASGESAPRTLFQSTNHITTPIGERAVGIAAVGLLALALPYGLRALWRNHRGKPLALLFGLFGVGFLGAQGLRLAPAAWETGNRATDFLFIGLAFLVAAIGVERWAPRGRSRAGRLLAAACVGVICCGGAVAGWSFSTRLSQPLLVDVDGQTIPSEPLALSRWVAEWLPGRRFAAPDADARLIDLNGRALARTGRHPDIDDILTMPELPPWQIPALREADLRYVVSDRRRRAGNNVSGYFFGVRPPAGPRDELHREQIANKFEQRGATRIFDSGRIRVLDLDGMPLATIFGATPGPSAPVPGVDASTVDEDRLAQPGRTP